MELLHRLLLILGKNLIYYAIKKLKKIIITRYGHTYGFRLEYRDALFKLKAKFWSEI